MILTFLTLFSFILQIQRELLMSGLGEAWTKAVAWDVAGVTPKDPKQPMTGVG